MIHAAETGDELGMVMGHIHTLIPKDHLDTLQENASVKISDVHLEKAGQIEQKANKQRDALQKYSLERQQELQGLQNTPGVTPA
jgi:adenylate kinase